MSADPWVGVDPSARAAVEAFKEALQGHYGDRLDQVVLFGSHARGEATSESDIDLLIVLRGPVDPLAEIEVLSDLAWEVDLEHDVLLSVVPLSAADYASRVSPLLVNVRREGVPA